jgi:hypothetical protein
LETIVVLSLAQQQRKLFHSMIMMRSWWGGRTDRYTFGALLLSEGIGFAATLPSVQRATFTLSNKVDGALQRAFYTKEQRDKMRKQRNALLQQKLIPHQIKERTDLNNLAISELEKDERRINILQTIIENNDPEKTSDPKKKTLRAAKRQFAQDEIEKLELKILGAKLSAKDEKSSPKQEQSTPKEKSADDKGSDNETELD